jgi:hypothetical protein
MPRKGECILKENFEPKFLEILPFGLETAGDWIGIRPATALVPHLPAPTLSPRVNSIS